LQGTIKLDYYEFTAIPNKKMFPILAPLYCINVHDYNELTVAKRKKKNVELRFLESLIKTKIFQNILDFKAFKIKKIFFLFRSKLRRALDVRAVRGHGVEGERPRDLDGRHQDGVRGPMSQRKPIQMQVNGSSLYDVTFFNVFFGVPPGLGTLIDLVWV